MSLVPSCICTALCSSTLLAKTHRATLLAPVSVHLTKYLDLMNRLLDVMVFQSPNVALAN